LLAFSRTKEIKSVGSCIHALVCALQHFCVREVDLCAELFLPPATQTVSSKEEDEGGKMMMQDAGIEAKEAAVREVAKLLPLPDSLATITTIRSDYALRQQVFFIFFILILSFNGIHLELHEQLV
jgi:hypothetical protein